MSSSSSSGSFNKDTPFSVASATISAVTNLFKTSTIANEHHVHGHGATMLTLSESLSIMESSSSLDDDGFDRTSNLKLLATISTTTGESTSSQVVPAPPPPATTSLPPVRISVEDISKQDHSSHFHSHANGISHSQNMSALTTADYLRQRNPTLASSTKLSVRKTAQKSSLRKGKDDSSRLDTVSLFTSTSSGSSGDGDDVINASSKECEDSSSSSSSAFSFSKLRSSTTVSTGDQTPRRNNNSTPSQTYISSKQKTEMSWTAREKKINRLRANNRRLLETTRQRMGKLEKEWNRESHYGESRDDGKEEKETGIGCDNEGSGFRDREPLRSTIITSNTTATTASTSATADTHSTISADSSTLSNISRELMELTRSKTRIRQMEKELKRLNLANERLEVRIHRASFQGLLTFILHVC